MEDVELVAGQQVERPQHLRLRVEVAGDVEHEPAIAKARSVHHADRRQDKANSGSRRRQQAAERLESIEHARRRDPHDADALDGIDDQRVRLGRRLTFDDADLEPEGWPAARPRAREVGTQVLRRECRFALERLGRIDRRHRVEAQRSHSRCHRHGSWEHRWQLVHGDDAGQGIERELVLGRRDAALERSGRVIGDGDADVLDRVEYDVWTLRHEAAIQEQAGDVRNPNAGAGSESSEASPGHRHDAVQIGDHVFDDEPAAHAARLRRVQRAEVDRPAARWKGLRAAVCEGEGCARGREIGCDAVRDALPAELQSGRGLGGTGAGCENQQEYGGTESVAHEREATPYRGVRISTCSVACVHRSSPASRSRLSVSSCAPSS